MSTRQKMLSFTLITILFFPPTSNLFAQEKIVVAGTGDSQSLLRALAEAFEKVNPGKRIEIPDSIGSGGGIKSTAKGICNLGRVARPLREKENFLGLNYKVFACSPVVLVANPSITKVKNLSTKDIIGIYSGKITSWDILGEGKRKIYVVNRENGDSSRIVLERRISGFKDIKKLAGQVVYSTPGAVAIIKKHEDTIGYTSLAMTSGMKLVVMKINGIYPSVENVKNETYKLVTPLGLAWKGELQGLAKEFFDFLFSPEGQKIIIQNGAVPPK